MTRLRRRQRRLWGRRRRPIGRRLGQDSGSGRRRRRQSRGGPVGGIFVLDVAGALVMCDYHCAREGRCVTGVVTGVNHVIVPTDV